MDLLKKLSLTMLISISVAYAAEYTNEDENRQSLCNIPNSGQNGHIQV
jgi:hypothetical protein